MSEGKLFLSVADVRKILGVSRTTVYRLLKKKEFQWISIGGKIYRISRPSFEEWLNEKMRYNKDIIDDSGDFKQLCDKLSGRKPKI